MYVVVDVHHVGEHRAFRKEASLVFVYVGSSEAFPPEPAGSPKETVVSIGDGEGFGAAAVECVEAQRLSTPNEPAFCQARYGIPSGPGAEAFAMQMALRRSYRFGVHSLASALHGGPSG